MRIVFLIGMSLLCACGGWDSSQNLNALGDEDLEALCAHFYDLAGGEPREETCEHDGVEFKAVLGDRSTEIADCKAKERPACQTQLLEDCVMSLNGSLCGDMNSAACRTYVDCELGT